MKTKKTTPARRSGLVVAMRARHKGGKHSVKANKRTAQKSRRFEAAAD